MILNNFKKRWKTIALGIFLMPTIFIATAVNVKSPIQKNFAFVNLFHKDFQHNH